MVIIAEVRINEEIKEKEVRLISSEGEQLGVVPIKKALELAAEAHMDLVEVAATAKPVVCKILDFGKFKYEKGKKEKEAKKKQKVVIVKEIKLKPRIDKHDLEVKANQIDKFLEKGYKIKVILTLFGRERSHQEIGMSVLNEMSSKFEEKAIIEKKFGEEESQSFIVLTPKK